MKKQQNNRGELLKAFMNLPEITPDMIDHKLLHKKHRQVGLVGLTSCRVCEKSLTNTDI